MQNNIGIGIGIGMGNDLISKSRFLLKTGLNTALNDKKTNVRDLINDTYYFGYSWKGNLAKLTNYTHSRPLYKLILQHGHGMQNKLYQLEKITTCFATDNIKIISIEVYKTTDYIENQQLTADYQDNIAIIERYMLDESRRHTICKYEFKILENDGIFSVMDSNYNLIRQNGWIDSAFQDGYMKSSSCISTLLENFIIKPSSIHELLLDN